ncbi:MAG: DUF1707 domain-containing protein [Candidatus Nanopelagicales bacterium]|nr:DUF1707 domain-containing protein [Candidatus Nanopelagicales bacterium]
MSLDPELRAGDTDRNRTIAVLTDGYAEGRLTNDEFQIRVDSAHVASTVGELNALVVDLPKVKTEDEVPLTNAVSRPKLSKDLRARWVSWLGVGILVNVIWGYLDNARWQCALLLANLGNGTVGRWDVYCNNE